MESHLDLMNKERIKRMSTGVMSVYGNEHLDVDTSLISVGNVLLGHGKE